MGKQSKVILDRLSPEQREAAETINRDVLVKAGAGSGKTKTLVARYLNLLDEHRDWHPSDITAVTFTRKAAREMQSRIREQMMELVRLSGEDSDEQQFWLKALNEMDSANIGTIHSLCGRILRAHPAEAGLDPAFSIQDENKSAMLISQIVEETISEISADPEYEPLLDFYSGKKLTGILTDMLKDRKKTETAVSVQSIDTDTFLKNKAEAFLFGSDYAVYVDEYRTILEDTDFQKKNKAFCSRLSDLIRCFDAACSALKTGVHPAEAVNVLYSAFSGWSNKSRSDNLNVNMARIRDDLKSGFPFLVKDSKHEERDINWYKDFWKDCDKADESLRKLWPILRDKYTRITDSSQEIDFDTMESLSLQLLQTHPEIRDIWAEKVKALLVDEFQDTNDEQAELFSMLNSSHDRLFAVGDKKQSIYAFRGTNVALFDRLEKEVKLAGGKPVMLDTTYRTKPELLLPMGDLLKYVMADTRLNGKDFYAPYEAMKASDISHPDGDALPIEPPCIDILLGDIQDKEDDPEKKIVGRMLAQRLFELMKTGMIHTWNDTAILCRKTDDFKQFEKALEKLNIPYVTVSGKGYYDRTEIRDILNILRTAENPHDNAALTGFLLSPSIGFTAEMTVLLCRYAYKGGVKKSFYQALTDADFSFDTEQKQEKLERARSILKELIRISGQVPLDESLEKAYRLTGIRTMLALDTGDRAWLNLDKLLTAARESKMTSVSEFLEYLENLQETGAREGEAPSDNNGAVRIMTIHQAKGLEFPVTVVYDNDFGMPIQANFYRERNGAYAFCSSPAHPRYEESKKDAEEREKAEWLRFFYVAATRAKYRLILCGNKPKLDGKKDTWLKRILAEIPNEMMEPDENSGPEWEFQGDTVRIRCCQKLPAALFAEQSSSLSEFSIVYDENLLRPITVNEKSEPRNPEHTAALTVGKLVHKGLELWHFPDENGTDPVLEEAFRKILMQTDNLNAAEQQAVREKAVMLLSRFRKSEAWTTIDAAKERWHELPFSFSGRSFVVNGVIDLLLKDHTGYKVIDFKTDELKSLQDLNNAVNNYSSQLVKYRRAVKTTLGEEPECSICFLDYCGNVILQPVGKDASFPTAETAEPDDWIQDDDPGLDDFIFEENTQTLPSLPPNL